MEHIWLVLVRRYGDTNLAIITTRAKLVNLETRRGKDFKKLWQGVVGARATLHALGAKCMLLNDITWVSALIAKDLKNSQNHWHYLCTSATFKTDPDPLA